MAEQPTPESLRGTLLVLIVLALIGATGIAVGGLYLQRGDSGQLYDELFADAELPYGFQRTGGTAMAGAQRWVRLTSEESSDVEGRALPESVLVGRYGSRQSARRLFEASGALTGENLSERIEEWTEEPSSSFEGLLEAGTLEFGSQETDYLRLRLYQADATWHEVVRIDASFGETGQVIAAHWADELADVDPEQLVPFLSALRLGAD